MKERRYWFDSRSVPDLRREDPGYYVDDTCLAYRFGKGGHVSGNRDEERRWKSSVQLWVEPQKCDLVYRSSIRIMVRPEGVVVQPRASSEERNGHSGAVAAAVRERKESLGVMQRSVVKEQFR